jgi:hypothetical protein
MYSQGPGRVTPLRWPRSAAGLSHLVNRQHHGFLTAGDSCELPFSGNADDSATNSAFTPKLPAIPVIEGGQGNGLGASNLQGGQRKI